MWQEYTEAQKKTGEWIRKMAAESYRGWKAFYHTKLWRKKREKILERDKHQCAMCRQQGRFTPATTVHHIIHLRDAPELALTDSNLMSLCSECHEAMHPEKHRHKGFVNEERW